MTNRVRGVCGVVAALLFGWMLYLYVVGPEFEFKASGQVEAVTVECERQLWGWSKSWDSSIRADELASLPYDGYTITEGRIPQDDGPGLTPENAGNQRVAHTLEHLCDRARTGQAGMMALLAVPAAALTAVAALWRGRRTDADV